MNIRRHTRTAIFIHWFNAICWLLLLFTGFGMLVNAQFQPVGQWWVNFMEGVFGGASGLLQTHIYIALTWICVYALYILVRGKSEALPFLKEITSLSPVSDFIWCVRKGAWLVAGPKMMRRMGMNPELPPQGFYNAGQKYVAIAAVLCSLTLVVTGALLIASRYELVASTWVQWSILVHFCCAGLMAIALPVHIYMAALAPGEAPSLRSMFIGTVPVDHVKHHNPLWYSQLRKQGIITETQDS